jgi:hypothetical protein
MALFPRSKGGRGAHDITPFFTYMGLALSIRFPLFSGKSLLCNSRVRFCRRLFFFRARSNLALSP